MGTNGTCKAYIVHCGDPRIQAAVQTLIADLGLQSGDYFPVSVKGGAANFAQVQDHLELAATVHHPEFIVLMTHEDCRAGACEYHLHEAYAIAESLGFKQVLLYHVLLEGTPKIVHPPVTGVIAQ